ncbi:MAG: phosphatase PAP2 family protein [Planctomycetaceae bacterium]
MLELAIVGVLSVAVGLAWAAAVRSVRQADPASEASVRVGEELAQRRGPRRFLRSRLDPQTVTGLALTLALGAVIVAGAVLGVLIAMIRGSTGIVNVDAAVTRWAASHDTPLSLSVLGWVTWAGSTIGVVLVATAAAAYAVVRRRRWSAALFLAVVVVGQFVLSNAIKLAVARVRPDAPPLHLVTGPSFPSGHATAAAATWAAAALVLGRNASPRIRAVLAGSAAAVAVAVACSRVLLGAHWMSDVLGGLVLGWTWFALCAVAFGGRVLRLGQPAERATDAPTAGATAGDEEGAAARPGAA